MGVELADVVRIFSQANNPILPEQPATRQTGQISYLLWRQSHLGNPRERNKRGRGWQPLEGLFVV